MLARIAYQLYWIGRYVSRAEHTARMLDGVFAASVQARPTAPSRQALSWEAVMAVMGAESEGDHPVAAGQAVRTLTLDPDSAASVTACVDRAREGARTVRDVVSTEMWEALNTLYLELDESDLGAALQTGPYSVYAFVRERCALFWGLAEQTMLRDPAFAFLSAGRHSEGAGMMLRMLRVTLFAGAAEGASGGERAIALLQAVGGLEAFRRSVAAPAEAEPVARFLTFESTYPHSITASIEALQSDLAEADPGGRSAPPILRLARLRAELEFHRGQRGTGVWRDEDTPEGEDTADAVSDLLEHVQHELEVVDSEVESRYFSGEAPQRQVLFSVRFEIAYETQYLYPKPIADSINAVRVKPAINQAQALESFALRVDPDARVHERRDYFGTDVLEFGIDEPHEKLSVKASAGVVTTQLDDPPEGHWESLGEAGYTRTAGEFLLLDPTASGPEDAISALLGSITDRGSPLEAAHAITAAIPERFTYRQGATFVGSTVDDLLDGGAGVCQDFVHLALILFRRLGFGARYVSGYLFAAPKDGGTDSVEVQTHAWLEALMPNGGGEARWIGFDPTNAKLAGETHVKIGHGRNYQDVPPIRGVYRGPPVSDLHTSVKMTRVGAIA